MGVNGGVRKLALRHLSWRQLPHKSETPHPLGRPHVHHPTPLARPARQQSSSTALHTPALLPIAPSHVPAAAAVLSHPLLTQPSGLLIQLSGLLSQHCLALSHRPLLRMRVWAELEIEGCWVKHVLWREICSIRPCEAIPGGQDGRL